MTAAVSGTPQDGGGSGHDPTMPTAGVINKQKSELADGLDPELVIAARMGDVLIKHTVLKADHFPSCHNTKLSPILDGAPNFRQVGGLPVYGVAIPTVTGLRQVMEAMGARKGQRRVYWQNLREEPLVFINGNPFVVREADQPFSNLEYTGIDRVRVEDMEVRLKADILTEAAHFNNRILVMHENEDLSLYDHWEPVTPDDVQTPQEVYAELKADGYAVDYLRVPVTDEKAPKDEDFEELIARLWAIPEDAGVIFNCQMGRGRTTTGMAIASLLYLRKMEAFPLKKGRKDTREVVPAWFKAATLPFVTAKGGPPLPEGSLEVRLKAGYYGVVRSLLRALERGPEAKAILDAVIDACGAMQNLREGIFSYRTRFLKEARENQRNVLLGVCLEYLERYYMLIAFSGYLSSNSFDPGTSDHVPFPQWMAARPELRSILVRLLRRNSMTALELHTRTIALPGSPAVAGSPGLGRASVDVGEGKEAAERDVVATRTGAVLGAYSILKEDNFPGMQSSKIAQTIEGAPNFRRMPGLPIYGVGMPTVDGITGVLRAVAGGGRRAGKQLAALWVNMREEPVVYINGRPFVLREEVRPLKNMMEYEGIDAARVEAMEERLKKDVLAEALRHGGRILVAHESFEYGHYGELQDTWEEIDHPDAVQTPAEVYAGLTEQGFAVHYCRLPVTDGAAPQLTDFDRLMEALQQCDSHHPVIFNCQMGIGRTTTGMVIASLWHVFCTGQMESTRSMPDLLAAADAPQNLVSGVSPRSDQEEGEEFRDPEDPEDKPTKVWDLAPEEVEEQRSLAAGNYVGVRRVVRLLEAGEQAKKVVDQLVDQASDLINLRVAIMKYRKPRSSYKFLRPELQQRAAAFKKGSAYLERYVLFIAFAYWLEHVSPQSGSLFSEWVRSRPDLVAAIESAHSNPGAALAPLPLPKPPIVMEGEEGGVLRDQSRVLARRKGRLLTKRTILKSYLFNAAPRDEGQPQLPDAPDLRQVQDDMPIYSVGSLTMDGLRSLLAFLGAAKGGKATVCITDIREELVVYVNGTPYTRRELEMPAAALHHAGVHATQLQEQEVLMREDVQEEVAAWGGRILLHRELQPGMPELRHILSSNQRAWHQPPNYDSTSERGSAQQFRHLPSHPEEQSDEEQAQEDEKHAHEDGFNTEPHFDDDKDEDALHSSTKVNRHVRRTTSDNRRDDVTNLVDANPGAKVAAFWEQVDIDSPTSVMTAREMVARLMSDDGGEGYQATYQRIPLSRERTPEAADIQLLHTQVVERQALKFGTGQRTETVHLILGRTATGSSARFVGAALTAYYIRPPRASLTGAPLLPPMGPEEHHRPRSPNRPSSASGSPPLYPLSGFSSLPPPLLGTSHFPHFGSPPGPGFSSGPQFLGKRASVGGSPSILAGAHPLLALRLSGDLRALKSLDTESGEYRGIMALCRLLPGGLDAKRMVDRAIELVRPIGNILADIARCKEVVDKGGPLQPMASNPEAVLGASLVQYAARQLGTHYLKRYFLLITYRCFLEQCGTRATDYAAWVDGQKELAHLLSHLKLE